jgi:peptidoglycan/LPS O-acetylase OafA/YrhL
VVGPFIHLWFLPFVLLASVFVSPAGRMVRSLRDVQIGSAALAVLGVGALWVSNHGGLPTPFPQWVSAMPSFAYGLLAGFGLIYGGTAWPLLAMVSLCGVSFVLTGEVWTLQPLIAALLFWGVWNVPLRARILPHLGQVAFGIYLMHPFFLLVCFKVLGAQMNLWVALVLTFAMSWAATICLRAVPFLRRMV